jgi:hypothetical protein
LERLAAHANENLLVDRNVLRIEVPVAVGHPRLVERKRLRGGCPCGKGRSAANIAIFIDDLPVEQNYFVGLTIGCGRYQLEGMGERLGRARVCDGLRGRSDGAI